MNRTKKNPIVEFSDPFAANQRLLIHDVIVYCNLKWNKPWALKLDRWSTTERNFSGEWLNVERDGYKSNAVTYYDFSTVNPGDLVRIAGGSGTQKYPQIIRVVSINDSQMEYEEICDKTARHELAKRNASPAADAAKRLNAVAQEIIQIGRLIDYLPPTEGNVELSNTLNALAGHIFQIAKDLD